MGIGLLLYYLTIIILPGFKRRAIKREAQRQTTKEIKIGLVQLHVEPSRSTEMILR